MAGVVQTTVGLVLGQTLFWQGAPIVWQGFVAGTNCSIINMVDNRTMSVVLTNQLTTTATG